MSSTSNFHGIFEREAGSRGILPFRDFMRLALNNPEVGYYAAGRAKVGRGGDFVTSVSTGGCFGQLLAMHAVELWERCGRPREFTVVEQGAGTGDLGRDFTEFAKKRRPDFFRSLRYLAVEIAPPEETPGGAAGSATTGKFAFLDAMPDFEVECGLFLCNELIDAFPVSRIRWDAARGNWMEGVVGFEPAAGGFRLSFREIEAGSDLERAIASRIPAQAYRDGYTTEICLELEPWCRSVAGLLKKGMALFIDYGFLAEDYYHPDRMEGTLQCYRRHRKNVDCMEFPGECDITAHIDWSAVRESAARAGLDYAGYADQGTFLTRLAEPLLLEWEVEDAAGPSPSPSEGAGHRSSWIRQFQTLTHPGMMGRAFGAMAFTRGLVPDPGGGEDSEAEESLPCPAPPQKQPGAFSGRVR